MRVFATSDLHVDYQQNEKWVGSWQYRDKNFGMMFL
jgi:hypothetical protein